MKRVVVTGGSSKAGQATIRELFGYTPQHSWRNELKPE